MENKDKNKEEMSKKNNKNNNKETEKAKKSCADQMLEYADDGDLDLEEGSNITTSFVVKE